MARLVLTVCGALLVAAASWLATAAVAAVILEKQPGGTREGGAAMAAAFLIGPVGAVVGLVIGAWILWQLAGDPARHGVIGMALGGGLIAFIVTCVIAFSPRYDPGIEWPKGMKGEAQVELRVPTAKVGQPGKDAFEFDLRCGGGSLHTAWDPKTVRQEGELSIVPAAFPLHDQQTLWLFAVLERGQQRGTQTIELTALTETTQWTEWAPMEGGYTFRFRTAVVPK